MKIWLLPDTHFNHDLMVAACGRPPDFGERIHKNIQSMVKPEDLLIHLGDVCIGGDRHVHAYIRSWWPGRKILVRGNHDSNSLTWYMTNGWDLCVDSFMIEYFGKKILFSHAPVQIPIGLSGADVNIHGHWHNTAHRGTTCDSPFRIRMSLEWANYQPVLLRTVMERGAPKGDVFIPTESGRQRGELSAPRPPFELSVEHPEPGSAPPVACESVPEDERS